MGSGQVLAEIVRDFASHHEHGVRYLGYSRFTHIRFRSTWEVLGDDHFHCDVTRLEQESGHWCPSEGPAGSPLDV